MKKRIGLCLLLSALFVAVWADIKPVAVDYVVRPLYGYRADGTPGRMVTVRFRYRLYPHEAYDVVETNRFGMEQSQPLVYVTADRDPQVQPLIAIDNRKVYSTIVKSLETDRALIVRLRSLSDREESVKLSFPKKVPARVSVCEREEIAGAPADGNLVMAPYGQMTLRLEY